MATRDVFSAEELEQLRRFPEVDRAELIRYFTLTPADEAFVRQFRGQGNVLGAAVQLCTLPWLGFVPDDVPEAPPAAVARLSQRLGIPVGELRSYGARGQTRSTGVMLADVSDTSELDASVLVAEVVGLLNEAECYIVAPEDEQLEYLHRRAALLHRLVDVLGDEPSRSLAQDADDRARRAQAVSPLSRSYFRLSRMRRWLRPRYTSGHDRPRDEEGEPP